jgi:hypothetical protein
MKNTVIIQFDIEGYHNYPNAPAQVQFLSFMHRHTFTIKAAYLVTNLNREREIFICRDEVKSYLLESFGVPCHFGAMSCEMIANEVLRFSKDDGMIWCEVWEEETGGARVEL